MKKIFLAGMVIILLSSCVADTDNTSGPDTAKTNTPEPKLVKTHPHLNDHVERVTIDGMPCLVWKDKVNGGSNTAYAYSGLDCDWSDR